MRMINLGVVTNDKGRGNVNGSTLEQNLILKLSSLLYINLMQQIMKKLQ